MDNLDMFSNLHVENSFNYSHGRLWKDVFPLMMVYIATKLFHIEF